MNRFSQSTVGRFTSADKGRAVLFVPQTLNRYVYAINDPINHVDRDGNEIICVEREDGPPACFPMPLAGTGGASGFLRQWHPTVREYDDLRGEDISAQTVATTVVTNANFSPSDPLVRTVRDGLTAIINALSAPGNAPCLTAIGGPAALAQAAHLLDTSSVGVGTITAFSASGKNLGTKLVGAETSIPVNAAGQGTGGFATQLMVNTESFFFRGGGNYGNTGIANGSTQAQIFILLHELTHTTQGITGRDPDTSGVEKGILSNCDKVIKNTTP